ncbi:MAG TPA: heavy metal translocating P-type ATPase [Nitrospiraceae bacterium]|nr:heavy metal translocating P-type ATPase [Nitrospiraceae bacterium]
METEDQTVVVSQLRTLTRAEVIHRLPGRVRMRVPWIKNSLQMAQGLAATLSGIEGINECRANAECASVTISYDQYRWTPAKLSQRLNALTSSDLKHLAVVNGLNGAATETERTSWFELSLSSAGVALGFLCEPLAPVIVPLLLAGSALPMLKRAYEAVATEGRLTVDVLDASATALLSVQGQVSMATFMVWLINLGDYIRDATVSQARSAVESVLSYQESFAWVVRGRRKTRIPVPHIRVGDTVIAYPGDRIPVDGIVLSGKAAVDQRALTGESMPVDKEAGAHVYAATVIHDGKLYIRTSHVGGDTEAAKIVRLIEGAPAHETAIQNYAERWANDLVPYSFVGAGVRGMFANGVSSAASVLVIDYGTGIRIAAPTTVLATMTKAVRQGILFKGGRALEQLAAVDAVVLDKTGTLTTGQPEISDVLAYGSYDPGKVLALAAAAEQRLNHPVAQAIVRSATDAKLTIPSRKSSDYTIGLGVTSQANGYVIHVGCMRYMDQLGIELPERAKQDAAELGQRAVSPVCVALDQQLVGLIGYADQIRPEAAAMVRDLKNLGIKEIVMLTGDHRDVADHVAKQLGITNYEAEVLPPRKVEVVKALQARGYRVAFIGDGINDSPALAHADIGVAVKGGADVAQETAHVVLLNSDLHNISTAITLARDAVSLIQENWNIIAVPNTVALTLACLGVLGPGAATLLSNGSAIVATGNALRPLWGNGTGAQSSAKNARSISASVTDRATTWETVSTMRAVN